MLELAMRTDPRTGRAMLDCDDIATILDQVDDQEHFQEPMAQALFDLIMEREGVISFPVRGVGEAGFA